MGTLNIDVSFLFQYIKAVRHLDGYCEVSFPHCPCDSRKEGHVIAIVGRNCFKLQACKTDGTIEVRIRTKCCINPFTVLRLTLNMVRTGLKST